jgi:hypothetical protein
MLVLGALAIYASGSIRVFSISMIIGITAGAYSSIFNASQIVVAWERWRARQKQAAGAIPTRRRERARVTNAAVMEPEEEEFEEGEAAEGTAVAGKPRKLSAAEAMARAEELAQEEKREERRERRKAGKGKGKSRRRF